MKFLKNKKAGVGEATGMTLGEIIGWILLAALVVFVVFYFNPYLRDFIAKLINPYLK